MTTVDLGELVLARFAIRDWREFDREFEQGKIGLEQCLQEQFRSVRVSARTIIAMVKPLAEFRNGVLDCIHYCHSKKMPFVVVSGGLDFVIQGILHRAMVLGEVSIFAPKAKVTKGGILLRFPKTRLADSANFKSDLVRWYKTKGMRVFFVGDGLSDLDAISYADAKFVIRGSRLARLCKRAGINAREIVDFGAVKSALEASRSYE
jgi:2-hydroxy-3-keto-5-methylthiopentenyl-1-phosphate phosphatase